MNTILFQLSSFLNGYGVSLHGHLTVKPNVDIATLLNSGLRYLRLSKRQILCFFAMLSKNGCGEITGYENF